MSNLYNKGINPIYESMANSKEVRIHNYRKIQEDALPSDIKPEDVSKYLTMILDPLIEAIKKQALSFPEPTIRAELGKLLLDKLAMLTNNASIDDLMKNLLLIWQSVQQKGQGSPYDAELEPIYKKVQEGISELQNAYKELKRVGGNVLMDPTILSIVNSKMTDLALQTKQSLEDAKTMTS